MPTGLTGTAPVTEDITTIPLSGGTNIPGETANYTLKL